MLVIFTLFLWAAGLFVSYLGWGFIECSIDAAGLSAVALFSCGAFMQAASIFLIMMSAQLLHALLTDIREKFKD